MLRSGKCVCLWTLRTCRMLTWSYIQWLLSGRPRCLYCRNHPAVQGFFCPSCHARLEAFLAQRRRSRSPL